ncbi:putative protein-serine/threonine phosphatase [Rosa chinensis]|uniref:protein-serine/threonine phosphatase n=1 Tax=Rosa chinensis TaxID=74649 RepID=A0A2P6QK53_ROSCH|nr:putative protein-serine/threonine phosphatase [Rosa chinensis]
MIQWWNMAQRLGATCVKKVDDPSVTHVVATQTDAGRPMAVEDNKFLVHFRWIEESNFMWQKQPEDKFPVPVIEVGKIVQPESASPEITLPGFFTRLRSVFLPTFLDPVTLLATISGLIGRKRKRLQ